MRSDRDAELRHNERLEGILKPLGFQSVRLGVFAQSAHPFIHFDLSAVEPDPAVVLPRVMDMLWDAAVAEGRKRHQAALREMLGLK